MNESFFGRLTGDLDPKRVCRVAVPFAHDEAVAYAICEAVRMGVCAPILIGDRKGIEEMYGAAASHASVKIVPEADAQKACQAAVDMVRNGEADILMKGLVPTSTILKTVLNSQRGIKKNPVLSHLTFFEIPKTPGLRILTDVALNIAPDAEMLAKEIDNAVEAYRLFGSDRAPRVALLAANEKVSEKVTSTVVADQVAKALAHRDDMIVEGPISLDLACSLESCHIKKYKGRIQGDADIYVVPRIETGNVLYKSLQYFARAAMGGLIYGAKCPIVLTSRADDNATKLNSLLLAMRLWQGSATSASVAAEA